MSVIGLHETVASQVQMCSGHANCVMLHLHCGTETQILTLQAATPIA